MTRLRFITFILLAYSTLASAQLTIKITGIPANTPPGAKIYAAGSFNGWNPADEAYVLTALGAGQFQLIFNPPAGELKFKFTLGKWDNVEEQADGSFLQDRKINYTGQQMVYEGAIATWKGFNASSGTAAQNVKVISHDFYMPELNKNRRIWLYLPPDYASTTKKYPVIYMQDGQSLFDDETSFAGEWHIDETLNELFFQGDYGCIVVGIDNGEADRLDEYSPWGNSKYKAGGKGHKYLEFIVNTLKPYVDKNYRTLPERNSTAIGGSSMGGLISMYAFSERQDVFSKALVFSPAFWFGGQNSFNHTLSKHKQGPGHVYFLSGADEEEDGNASNYVVEDMVQVADAMGVAGFDLGDKYLLTPAYGKHTESFWANEFSDAYLWLLSGAVSTTAGSSLDFYPNPVSKWIRLKGVNSAEMYNVKILNTAGKTLQNLTIAGKDPVWVGDLPGGTYKIKIRKKGGKWLTKKMVK